MGGKDAVHNEDTRNRKIHCGKRNSQSQNLRFFKIIFGEDCEEVLYLPPQFAPTVQHLVNENIKIEDSCEDQWPVKLSQHSDGSLIFRSGWSKFFQDHDLKEGEFLVFEYVNEGHFNVCIFGKSACERKKFNNGRSSQNKRLRRDSESDSPCEAVKNTRTTLKEKPSPGFAVASGAESENAQMQLSVKNANSKELQIPPGMEDNCMINRECEHHGQDMNILYDLSIFEMGSMPIKHANKLEEATDTELGNSHGIREYVGKFDGVIETGIAEHSNTKHYSTHMSEIHTNLVHEHSDDVFTGNFNKDLDTRLVSSKTESMEHCKMTEHAYQNSEDKSNVIIGSSGEISVTKFQKDSISKASPCSELTGKTKTKTQKDSVSKASPYAKITGETKSKFDASEMDVVNIDPVIRNSGGNMSISFCPKPSDNKNLSKGMLDNVFKLLHGCGTIAGRENLLTSQCFTSSVSRSEHNNPIETGKISIKKELEELKQIAPGFPMSSCGYKPNTGMELGQVLSSVVKIEPDLSFDTSPLVSSSPVVAEVKHMSCLVLPEEIPSFARRKEHGRPKVVYLTDPMGRVWPILYVDDPIASLTCNWRNFCEHNNIKIGDVCTFEPEDDIMGGCRVAIAHSS